MTQDTPQDRFAQLRAAQQNAYARAPAIRALYDLAGTTPQSLQGASDLSRLPVTSKDALLEQQLAAPPFGGFLAANSADIRRIFASPGPIYEPQFNSDKDGHGFAQAFASAGVGPGDRVLNTWSYHLVPAGLLLDEGIAACGATVLPAGTGGAELQAKLIRDLGVTCICASTAFFIALVETLEQLGSPLPASWKVRTAMLGGEMGDWMGKRKRLEQRYGITTFSAYATGDFGLIGFEEPGQPGYTMHPGRLVQICDPVSGEPLPVGVPGEIVVTTLSPGWPLIRFGTGDVACALSMTEDGLVQRMSLLQGRVGQAVKAREIFIYPRQIEELSLQVPGIHRAQVLVTKPNNRELVTLKLSLQSGLQKNSIQEQALEAFQRITRLKADSIEFLEPGTELPDDALLLLDKKHD